MAINIRTATSDDIMSLVDCREDFIFEVSGQPLPNHIKESMSTYIKENIDTDSFVCYIATDDEKIIAMVMLCTYHIVPKLNNSTGKVGYVQNVYTLKEYRGQGLAKELMNRLIETAKNMGVNEILLNAEEKAVPLYQSLGFQLIDREMMLRF